MSDQSRRGFLRGIVAAAVAVQVPQLIPASSATLVDEITTKIGGIVANGRCVESIHVVDVGGGWYRVSASFRAAGGDAIAMDFSRINDGKGLAIVSKEQVDGYLRDDPGHIVTNEFVIPGAGRSGEPMTLSMFVKPQSDGATIAHASVEAQRA